MIVLSPRARRQVGALVAHYERLDRIEAAQKLFAAIEAVSSHLLETPQAGLSAPRPYPDLAKPGRRWLHIHRYWIAYTLSTPPVIIGVYYDAADIPRRL